MERHRLIAEQGVHKTRLNQQSRVSYRPLDAAIRWAGLTRSESAILKALGYRNRLEPDEIARWPLLHICAERIFDGMVNGDLPYGHRGITSKDPSLLNSNELTIRHVDLKAWMTRFYPGQKPEFLFDDFERQLHPAISVESVQALLTDREAIRIQLAERVTAYEMLFREHESLRLIATKSSKPDQLIGARAETTYLNIVGGLLTLLLGTSPAGKPYSSFRTMESVITALLAHYEGHPGIAERTLWAKLAEAKRKIEAPAR